MKASITYRVNVQSVELSLLRPWTANPRRLSDSARAGLRASLGRFGLVEPVMVNRVGKRLEVVGGHQRLGLLLEAGVRRARCVVVELPAAEARALALTLNNPAVQGEWTEAVQELVLDLQKSADVADLGLDLLMKGLP